MLNDLLYHHVRAALIAVAGGTFIMFVMGITWESFSVFFIFSTGRVGEYLDFKRKLKKVVR